RKPKPMAENPGTALPFLSIAAPSPIGFGKRMPHSSCDNSAYSFTPYIALQAASPPGTLSAARSPSTVSWHALPGRTVYNTCLSIGYNIDITPVPVVTPLSNSVSDNRQKRKVLHKNNS